MPTALELRVKENAEDIDTDDGPSRNHLTILLNNEHLSVPMSFHDLLFAMEALEKLHGTRRLYPRIADLNGLLNQPLHGNQVGLAELANSGIGMSAHSGILIAALSCGTHDKPQAWRPPEPSLDENTWPTPI